VLVEILRTQKIQVRALSLGPNLPVVFNNDDDNNNNNNNNGDQHTTGVRRALAPAITRSLTIK